MYKAAIGLFLLILSTTFAFADMPKELKGTWVLDADATKKNILGSPRLKPEDMKYLPTILKRMSQYLWEFNDDAISSSRGAKKNTLSVGSKERDKNKYIFVGKLGDQVITLTVIFVNNAVINIRSSATDDMNYYLWKRGQLNKDDPAPGDGTLSIELLKKSLNNPADK